MLMRDIVNSLPDILCTYFVLLYSFRCLFDDKRMIIINITHYLVVIVSLQCGQEKKDFPLNVDVLFKKRYFLSLFFYFASLSLK